ncbi:Osmotically-inducible protein OsmY, contains BON domain [Nakamurella panacisegetis]|uniref:Osmotically-inducible protein OsmY, contains BON domain n=1 Tax=Nakamurella panacisegetis TaxID=1090615 RepID=A0A1H0SAJ0_9ACTN|nr:BON domain-containing protein [Nakamurella panacisegetis]SDP38687.1 Osmotically-inducible protein OsmY, contains BON domain [Nakamurella panacisegetis]
MIETAKRTSEQLTDDARQALAAQPQLRGLPIFVQVDNGAATLYGRTETKAQALIAQRTVLGVSGVHVVAQKLLTSAPPRLSDTDIAVEVAAALASAPHVPDSVRATVQDRRITLTGEVNWQYESQAACRAVDELPGARSVLNAITVRSGTMAAELERLILATLANRDPLSDIRLTVTTNSRGAIMLDGTVPTVEARREAEAICWGVPGAASVTNHLVVAPITQGAGETSRLGAQR